MIDGAPPRVCTARTMAVEMTKRPEQSRIDTPTLRSGETRRLQSIGTGTIKMATSETTLRTTRIRKFCGRNVQLGPGRGRICQFQWKGRQVSETDRMRAAQVTPTTQKRARIVFVWKTPSVRRL
jgi:hypothetical protein